MSRRFVYALALSLTLVAAPVVLNGQPQTSGEQDRGLRRLDFDPATGNLNIEARTASPQASRSRPCASRSRGTSPTSPSRSSGRRRLSANTSSGIRDCGASASCSTRFRAYFPAITALRCSPFFQEWAEGLRQRGKGEMAVIGAAMRKLVHPAYGVLKTGKPFDPQWAQMVSSY